MDDFIFIHIGKCAGASVHYTLKDLKKKFKIVHLEKPKIFQNKDYLITIRDPIGRFVSGFNWKKERVVTENISSVASKNEYSGFVYWDNVNNLAENLYNGDGTINKKAASFIKDVNHLMYDIHYHLENMIDVVDSKYIKVLRFEHLNSDFKKLFGIDVQHKLHVNANINKYLSRSGRDNLKKFLAKDYRCIEKLIDYGCIENGYAGVSNPV